MKVFHSNALLTEKHFGRPMIRCKNVVIIMGAVILKSMQMVRGLTMVTSDDSEQKVQLMLSDIAVLISLLCAVMGMLRR